MNTFRNIMIFAAVISLFLIPFAYRAGAAGPKVSEESATGNKHNLSARAWSGGSYSGNNPNTYKATDVTENPKGQQICIFCHTPHSANPDGAAPLWNRRFSAETFSRYSSATIQIRVNSAARTPAGYDTPAWQPDGSSKLCLSCHDGVASLGDVLNGGPIAMTNNVIMGISSFNPSNNKMKTGHHPISFVYTQAVANAINSPTGKNLPVNTYVLPPTSGALNVVKLDKNGKMQCTTCHNAHQNQTNDDDCYVDAICTPTSRKKAPFWVYGASGVAPTDRDAVCQACHPLTSPSTGTPGFTQPWLAP